MLAKVRGWQCRWPVAVWSMKLCLRKDLEQVLDSHKPGGPASCYSSRRSHHTLNIQTPEGPHRDEHSRPSLLRDPGSTYSCSAGCVHGLEWHSSPA